jgi:5-methylcytosine-specific restriction endonuclease McrA
VTRQPWNRNPRRDALRRIVLARDRGICHLCGIRGATTVDHLVPRSAGGTDDPANLAAAHASCNYRRGAQPLTAPQTSRTY